MAGVWMLGGVGMLSMAQYAILAGFALSDRRRSSRNTRLTISEHCQDSLSKLRSTRHDLLCRTTGRRVRSPGIFGDWTVDLFGTRAQAHLALGSVGALIGKAPILGFSDRSHRDTLLYFGRVAADRFWGKPPRRAPSKRDQFPARNLRECIVDPMRKQSNWKRLAYETK